VKAATRIKIGLRTALRRRYGYAALRHLRTTLARAIEVHEVRTFVDLRPYDGQAEGEAIRRGYRAAIKALLKRWPNLDLSDPRAEG
jgi:hypothetical protein